MKDLETILEVEDKGDFDKAYELYNRLYKTSPTDYEIWKHFYFFLWIAIEDAKSEFHEKVNLRQRLQEMYGEGKSKFQHKTEFKFIAGYSVSIFPYEFGDYDDLEKEGHELLRQAYHEEPDNNIYRMVYLGSTNFDKIEYRQSELDASPVVLKKFQGPGLMNNYFKQVLNRIDKKA